MGAQYSEKVPSGIANTRWSRSAQVISASQAADSDGAVCAKRRKRGLNGDQRMPLRNGC